MEMSTHIVGIVPPDKEWEKMKAVYDSCVKAGIEVPKEVWEFFNHEEPDEEGVLINIEPPYNTTDEENKHGVSGWSDECGGGFQVDLSKLPKHIKKIRFYNSW